MGYTTDFSGEFKLNKPLAPEHQAYLNRFSDTRRMKRNADLTAKLEDKLREAVKLPIGDDAGYFVGAEDGEGFMNTSGQRHTSDILEYNYPPTGQPGLWCQWVPSEDGTAIEWNGAEKFYEYVPWIKYLIAHFLKPWGYVVNGEVTWVGEDPDDRGKIVIKDNVVTTKVGRITYD